MKKYNLASFFIVKNVKKSTPRVAAKKEKRKTQGQNFRKLLRKIAEKNKKDDYEIFD